MCAPHQHVIDILTRQIGRLDTSLEEVPHPGCCSSPRLALSVFGRAFSGGFAMLRHRTAGVLTFLCFCTLICFLASGIFDRALSATPPNKSSAEGLAAWEQVYSVLTSPRCINCHTATKIGRARLNSSHIPLSRMPSSA